MHSSPKLDSDQLRLFKNMRNNRQVLKSLGYEDKSEIHKDGMPAKHIPERKTNVTRQEKQHNIDQLHRPVRHTRRSSAIMNALGYDTESIEFPNGSNDEENTPPTKIKFRHEARFGEVEGVNVGDWWMTRMECSSDGIHRPTVAGIHAKLGDGCYSIALSGGYEDDLDCGEYFTYTGCGGRDLKGTQSNPKNLRTAPQTKDQSFDGLNAALASNVESRKPVRVIRGYKLNSPYAPEEGYRYDGLYSVEKCWMTTGNSGFKVCKYALKRLPDQDPPPWTTCPLLLNPEKNQLLRIPVESSQTPDSSLSSSSFGSPEAENSTLLKTSAKIKIHSPSSRVNGKINITMIEGDKEHSESIPGNLIMDSKSDKKGSPKIICDKRPELSPAMNTRLSSIRVYNTGDNSSNRQANELTQKPVNFLDLSQTQVKPKIKQSITSKNCKVTISQNINVNATPSNMSKKKVSFSPKIYYADEEPVEPINDKNCKEENGLNKLNECLDLKKQTSILQYFVPVEKSIEKQLPKVTVNPKSLRGNRMSLFPEVNSKTKVKMSCHESSSTKNNAMAGMVVDSLFDNSESPDIMTKSSSRKRKYTFITSFRENNTLGSAFPESKRLTVVDNLIIENQDKLRLHYAKIINNKKGDPAIKMCSVKVVKLEDCRCVGWDLDGEFCLGFNEEQIETAALKSDNFEKAFTQIIKSQWSLEKKSTDFFLGWDDVGQKIL